MPSKPYETIRILIVDDHPLIRAGIAAVIRGEQGMDLVGEAIDGRDAVSSFERLRPDVTLMDILMPRMGGIEATAAIRRAFADARVIMLTTYRGDAQTMRALKAGACAYMLKSMILTELMDAIRIVHQGGRYIPADVALDLAAHVTEGALTEREREVLRLVAVGNSNRATADHLRVSEDTVKARMKAIMDKLSAKDRTHAVTIAMKRGIIEV